MGYLRQVLAVFWTCSGCGTRNSTFMQWCDGCGRHR